MSENIVSGLSNLLEMFEDNLTLSDINTSKYLGKISAAITKKRIDMNMTQAQFAKYMNVSQGMISRWEGGDYNFTIRSIAEIAEKLELDFFVSLKDVRDNYYVQASDGIAIAGTTSSEQNYVGKSSNVVPFRKQISSKEADLGKIYSFSERIEM